MEYSELVRQINKIALLHRIKIRERTSKIGPYAGPWMHVLGFVKNNDGCTQIQLANFLRVTAASVALSTKRLQKAGLLDKEVDENNLRCNRLHVTPAGERLIADCKDILNQFDQEIFAGFDSAELETLYGYLNRIAVNLGGGRELDFGEILDLKNKVKN